MDTTHVRRAVQVLHPADNTSALGAPFGSLDHINAQVRRAVESSNEVRHGNSVCGPRTHRGRADQEVRRRLQVHLPPAAQRSQGGTLSFGPLLLRL